MLAFEHGALQINNNFVTHQIHQYSLLVIIIVLEYPLIVNIFTILHLIIKKHISTLNYAR